MLTFRRHAPALGRGQLRITEHVIFLMAIKNAATVHPRPEIGGNSHIRAGGDDALRKFSILPLPATDLSQNLAKGGLGGMLASRWHARRREAVRHMDHGRLQGATLGRKGLCEINTGQEVAQFLLGHIKPFEFIPFMPGADTHGGAEAFHLLLRHQPGVVVLMPGKGQAHALDGIGNEAGGLIARRILSAEGLSQRFNIVSAQIVHQRGKLIIRKRVNNSANAGDAAKVGQDGGAPGGTALEGQSGVEAVRAIINPAAQLIAIWPRKGRFQPAAIFERDDIPAHVAEQAFDPAKKPVWHNGIERLAVVIHHPPDIADIVLPAFQQGFVDIALIQFGIAHHGHMPAWRNTLGRHAVQMHIILHERPEGGERDTKPDRTGGKINLRPVLHARRIGLDAAELAQRFKLVPLLPPKQVIDGVEYRPRMRLYRHAIGWFQNIEVKRCQDGNAGSARRLMPAHLQPVPIGADMIGVMDHPGGKPKQLTLQRMQHFRPPGATRQMAGLALALHCHDPFPQQVGLNMAVWSCRRKRGF